MVMDDVILWNKETCININCASGQCFGKLVVLKH